MSTINTIVSGQPSAGFTLTFTPTVSSGSPTTIPFHSLIEVSKVPSDKANISKFKPASGTGAGEEDFVVGSDQVCEPVVKALFEKSYYATLLSIRKQKGAFVLTFSQGSTMTGNGALLEAAINALNADDEMTVTMNFALKAGQTFVA